MYSYYLPSSRTQGRLQIHPKYDFPEDWDIDHTDNRWLNMFTRLGADGNKIKKELGLPRSQPTLIIGDVFAARHCESVTKALTNVKINYVFVPACCTVFNTFKVKHDTILSDWGNAEIWTVLD